MPLRVQHALLMQQIDGPSVKRSDEASFPGFNLPTRTHLTLPTDPFRKETRLGSAGSADALVHPRVTSSVGFVREGPSAEAPGRLSAEAPGRLGDAYGSALKHLLGGGNEPLGQGRIQRAPSRVTGSPSSMAAGNRKRASVNKTHMTFERTIGSR